MDPVFSLRYVRVEVGLDIHFQDTKNIDSDTRQIVGGGKHELNPEDYILAVVEVRFRIFLKISTTLSNLNFRLLNYLLYFAEIHSETYLAVCRYYPDISLFSSNFWPL